MATRKPTDNDEARAEAAQVIDRAQDTESTSTMDAVTPFPYVEYETATSKVGGQEIQLRRLVLTGEWQVVPN